MADIADITTDRLELEEALRRQLAPVDIGPAPIGRCHNCDAYLEGDARFCDADCRGDWQARQNMKRITGQ